MDSPKSDNLCFNSLCRHRVGHCILIKLQDVKVESCLSPVQDIRNPEKVPVWCTLSFQDKNRFSKYLSKGDMLTGNRAKAKNLAYLNFFLIKRKFGSYVKMDKHVINLSNYCLSDKLVLFQGLDFCISPGKEEIRVFSDFEMLFSQ